MRLAQLATQEWTAFSYATKSTSSSISQQDSADSQQALNCLQNAWKESSPELRKHFPIDRPRTRALKKAQSPDKITCPSFLRLQFHKWTEDPSQFFATSDPTSRDLASNFIGQLYIILKDLTEKQIINRLFRFAVLFLREWKADFCDGRLSRYGKSDFVDAITQ